MSTAPLKSAAPANVDAPDTFTSSSSVWPSISTAPLKSAAPANVDAPDTFTSTASRSLVQVFAHLAPLAPKPRVLLASGIIAESTSPPNVIVLEALPPKLTSPLKLAVPANVDAPDTLTSSSSV